MLTHMMFQRHHIRPAVFNSVCSAFDTISIGERAFMIASEKKAHEDGDIGVAIKNFAKKEGE